MRLGTEPYISDDGRFVKAQLSGNHNVARRVQHVPGFFNHNFVWF